MADAELVKAKADLEAAEKQVAVLRDQLANMKLQSDSNPVKQAMITDLSRRLADAEKAAAAARLAWQDASGAPASAAPVSFSAPAAAPSTGIKHVWTKEDTYASLAQKHYGSFQEPYWRLIYDYNKAIIGDHPNAIRVGLEIIIPPLPDELKKK